MPVQLQVFATIAPLLPVEKCSEEGLFESILEDLVVNRGYQGIEAQLSQILLIGKARFIAGLEKFKIKFIGKVYSSGGPSASPFEAGFKTHPKPGSSVEEHIAVWNASVFDVCSADLLPYLVSINSQGGRDYFHRRNNQEACLFIENALKVEYQVKIRIQHETHRYRMFNTPYSTHEILERYPTVNLLGDLSHFCVVCEVNPGGDEMVEQNMESILKRITHIHARVGFDEGPQVLHPDRPEYTKALSGFMQIWWKKVFLHHISTNTRDVLTVTPEFLPSPYAPIQACDCHTNPSAENKFNYKLDAINDLMAAKIRNLWATCAEEVANNKH
jgi:hypothetical protein